MKLKIRKALVSIIGFLLLVLGVLLALPGVPGPGLLIAVAGLTLLSSEYQWAQEQHDIYAKKLDDMVRAARSVAGKSGTRSSKRRK